MSFYKESELEKIGFKSLGNNVLISDKCSIYNPGNISIGDNTRIDDFSILSSGEGGIEIGRYVHIACFASLIGQGKITMSDYSGVSSRVSIYSSSDNYNGDWMTNPCLPDSVMNTIHDDVYLGKHVVVGASSIILPGIRLEDGCAVGAMSLVNKSFEEFSMIKGCPGKSNKKRNENILDLESKINKLTVI